MRASEWYYAEGMIMDWYGDRRDGRLIDGHPDSADYLLLMNANRSPDAQVTVTFFYEEEDPREWHTAVPARHCVQILLHEIDQSILQWNKHYGVRVRSDVPILAQETRGEYEPGDPATNAMTTVWLQPGPLGDESKDVSYVDGIILADPDHPLLESEWISILNPGDMEAHCDIIFYFMDLDREPAHMAVTVSPQRVKVIKLDDVGLLGKGTVQTGATVFYSVRIRSDVPIVAEEVRRAYARPNPITRSMFAAGAVPYEWED